MSRLAIVCLVGVILGSAGVCFVVFQPPPFRACAPSRAGVMNRSAVIATLTHVAAAQSQCQASGVIDANGNGHGEYGFFGELSGRTIIRGSNLSITPPVLSAAFGNVANSVVSRHGYLFQIFLPSKAADGVVEDEAGGDVGHDNGVDPGRAEELWCCYAWPAFYGKSGHEAFFINQSGKVLVSCNAVTKYSGASRPPTSMAAFLPACANIGGAIAAGKIGSDRESWSVMN